MYISCDPSMNELLSSKFLVVEENKKSHLRFRKDGVILLRKMTQKRFGMLSIGKVLAEVMISFCKNPR